MKHLFSLALLALLALSALASASATDHNLPALPPLDEEDDTIEPATDADSPNYADALLPIRPSNSGEEATCSTAKSLSLSLARSLGQQSGSFGNCGWCGEHGNVGRRYECVMVGDKCIGPTEECSRWWNARACRDFALSVGAIIGITVGGASACALAFCECCCWICFRRRRRAYHDELEALRKERDELKEERDELKERNRNKRMFDDSFHPEDSRRCIKETVVRPFMAENSKLPYMLASVEEAIYINVGALAMSALEEVLSTSSINFFGHELLFRLRPSPSD
jgi:hypothetical protein